MMDEEIRQALTEVQEMKKMCGNINMKLTNIVTQRGQNWKAKLEAEYHRGLEEGYERGLAEGKKAFDLLDTERDAEYQRGLEDAWEAAKKIADMWTRIDNDELLAIFGITERIGHSTIRSMFEKQTANEAMLELEAYEEKQKAEDEIKVGDEVEYSVECFAVTVMNDEYVFGISKDGTWCYASIKKVRKTGRHFDIASILKEMQS